MRENRRVQKMQEDYVVRLDLLRLNGAFLTKCRKKNGDKVDAVVIPVNDSMRIDKHANKAFLDLCATVRKNYFVSGADSHYIQRRATIGDDFKNSAIYPIVGHMRPRAQAEDMDEEYQREEVIDVNHI